jgi:hypothetical protein
MTQTMYAHVNKWIIIKTNINTLWMDKKFEVKICTYTYKKYAVIIFEIVQYSHFSEFVK